MVDQADPESRCLRSLMHAADSSSKQTSNCSASVPHQKSGRIGARQLSTTSMAAFGDRATRTGTLAGLLPSRTLTTPSRRSTPLSPCRTSATSGSLRRSKQSPSAAPMRSGTANRAPLSPRLDSSRQASATPSDQQYPSMTQHSCDSLPRSFLLISTTATRPFQRTSRHEFRTLPSN